MILATWKLSKNILMNEVKYSSYQFSVGLVHKTYKYLDFYENKS